MSLWLNHSVLAATMTWSKVDIGSKKEKRNNCPYARKHHSCSLVGNKLFMFGGNSFGDEYRNDVWILHIPTQHLEATPLSLHETTDLLSSPCAKTLSVVGNGISSSLSSPENDSTTECQEGTYSGETADPRVWSLLERLELSKYWDNFVRAEVVLEDIPLFTHREWKDMAIPAGFHPPSC